MHLRRRNKRGFSVCTFSSLACDSSANFEGAGEVLIASAFNCCSEKRCVFFRNSFFSRSKSFRALRSVSHCDSNSLTSFALFFRPLGPSSRSDRNASRSCSNSAPRISSCSVRANSFCTRLVNSRLSRCVCTFALRNSESTCVMLLVAASVTNDCNS